MFLSTLQIATQDQVFIIDCIETRDKSRLATLLEAVFNNKNILKLGQSIHNDLEKLNETFGLKLEEDSSYVNIEHFFQKSSLQKTAMFLFNKKFCKYEQCSNWLARPMLKTQLHYAALDAGILVMIYD